MTVLNFPSEPAWKPSDRTELLRWSIAAPGIADWHVQPNDDNGLTFFNDEGGEYGGLANGGPSAAGRYIVSVTRRGWLLKDVRTGQKTLFRTLKEALEWVCRTLEQAA